MTDEETIELLRHYRHDWMNQIQLLMGYTSMRKIERVEDKLKECVRNADNERKLVNLNIPKTAIWLISFNWSFENFRIEYKIDTDNSNLLIDDQLLHKQFNEVMETFTTFGMNLELYHGTITIRQLNNQDNAEVEVYFSGVFDEIDRLKRGFLEKNKLYHLKIKQLSNDRHECKLTWICS
ncbi:Spo0B domain-containing protein [Aquibacillus rhizosphaerae]|uniref:Spo0B domain-containing protein n=1 Tax=Aquibacillus rhizosphaerae TaxID=3051431 RepID=A0ABT7LAS8_9BACI|nr:Spo0B domain-containing protein [Aquibacillus sp. LR5S19]MDL4841656.1 Spo0B domain-containing protein [Aquibacillus sp. LR5S19]